MTGGRSSSGGLAKTVAVLVLATGAAIVVFAKKVYKIAKERESQIVEKPLPESGKAAAEKLLPALLKSSIKHGKISVRASLFSSRLESLYGYMMDGMPSIMYSIAQAKARAAQRKDAELLNPKSLFDTATKVMLPWLLGQTDIIPVLGVAKVILPGVDGINYFVVNGAADASVDLAIAEECLTECGLMKDPATDVWTLLPITTIITKGSRDSAASIRTATTTDTATSDCSTQKFHDQIGCTQLCEGLK